jgi:RNA polymerase sigma-70 factor (ECF subfamily)
MSEGRPEEGAEGLASTQELLDLARAGDRDALDRLMGRYLSPLRRFAHGRLPRWARDMIDTDDIVQETLARTLSNLAGFERGREGALHAYLRESVHNRVRDEVRRIRRRPLPADAAPEEPAGGDPSPLEEAIGREALAAYESALARLRAEEREVIIARVEMGLSYAAIAEALGKPSADAARMAAGRALVRLAEEMGIGAPPGKGRRER